MGNLIRKLKYFDLYLFLPYLLLCMAGIVMVYSASSINLSYASLSTNRYMVKQALYVLFGLVIVLSMAHINLRFLSRARTTSCTYFVLIVALIFAKMSGSVNGASGWINLGFMSIQPSEFCKLFLAVYMARHFAIREKKIENEIIVVEPLHGSFFDKAWQALTRVLKPNRTKILVGFMLFLILIEPDFGGFAINSSILFVIWLASKPDYHAALRWLTAAGIFIIVVLEGMRFIAPSLGRSFYQIRRFTAFYDPFKYAGAEGKQLVNSYYAISNGGFIGRGLGNSIQKRGYLPEPYTDFILSIISEEKGFLGTAVILVLLAWIICRIILIGTRSNNTYNSLTCYGIGTFMMVETLFNVGGVCGLLPITGVTLPFISYGGSSMLVLSFSLGIVMSISANERRNAEVDFISVPQVD